MKQQKKKHEQNIPNSKKTTYNVCFSKQKIKKYMTYLLKEFLLSAKKSKTTFFDPFNQDSNFLNKFQVINST